MFLNTFKREIWLENSKLSVDVFSKETFIFVVNILRKLCFLMIYKIDNNYTLYPGMYEHVFYRRKLWSIPLCDMVLNEPTVFQSISRPLLWTWHFVRKGVIPFSSSFDHLKSNNNYVRFHWATLYFMLKIVTRKTLKMF